MTMYVPPGFEWLRSGAVSMTDPDRDRNAAAHTPWNPDDRIELHVFYEILDERRAFEERHRSHADA